MHLIGFVEFNGKRALRVDFATTVAASLLFGLFVAKRFAASVYQIFVGFFAPRTFGAFLKFNREKDKIKKMNLKDYN